MLNCSEPYNPDLIYSNNFSSGAPFEILTPTLPSSAKQPGWVRRQDGEWRSCHHHTRRRGFDALIGFWRSSLQRWMSFHLLKRWTSKELCHLMVFYRLLLTNLESPLSWTTKIEWMVSLSKTIVCFSWKIKKIGSTF